MRNRRLCFCFRVSARVSRVGFGVAPKQSFLKTWTEDPGISRLACWFRRRAETVFPKNVDRGSRHRAREVRDGGTPSPARETRALPKRTRCVARLRADRLLRAGSLADSFTKRSGVRGSRCFRNAFRHTARSIARERERDQLGRSRAKANRARRRRAPRITRAISCADRYSRPINFRFHAWIAQRTHTGSARWRSDQSRFARRI